MLPNPHPDRTPGLNIMPKEPGAKVIVGMSGGVDSSLSALLLKEQGYQVEGLFMKNWNEDDGTEYCTALTDLMDAAAVCQKLDIYLHTVNFAKQYWDKVFAHFLAEYRAGRTPNPDVLCNREIKFKVFLDYAKELGADYIATGHYAQIQCLNGNRCLVKGIDPNKDQSYFLHAVGSAEFEQSCFPLGELHKTQVRALAEQHDLVTHNKKDSTGICFIGERRFKDFLENYLPAQPGEIRSVDGQCLGEHTGLMYYTIGQRQGLGIGGVAGSNHLPWFVADKDLSTNTLIVVQGEHPLLYSHRLIAEQVHWINSVPECLEKGEPWHCVAKNRYRQADQVCCVSLQNDGQLRVDFEQAQRAITPGQSVVFYEKDRCYGGAVIVAGLRDNKAQVIN